MNVVIDEKQIDDFLSRGVADTFPNKEFIKSRMLEGKQLTMYLGIDPTGPTLHVGHIIPMMKLSAWQKLGHKAILLMGDFTAMIGDPTDKSATRVKQTHEQVMENLSLYKEQASALLSFEGDNPAEFLFNSKWLAQMKFEDVLELAANFTVGQMIERDMFQERIKSEKPIYLHEFLYPLMQGYDSVAMNVDGEVCGNDQTFNALAGRTLVKSMQNREKFVLPMKLLADSSGKKMGKTEGNMVELRWSAPEMFGAVMSWSDEMLLSGFELCTFVPMEEIEGIKHELEGGANPRDLKARLAREIVTIYHGEEAAKAAEADFIETFAKGGVPDDIQTVETTTGSLLMDVVIENGLVPSKSEYRRLLTDNAISVNEEKISDEQYSVSGELIIKVGKRRFLKVIAN